MTAYLLTNHLLNFMAPAAFVALVLAITLRIKGLFFKRKAPLAPGLFAQIAIIFIVNVLVLAAGLVLFGNDAKTISYAAMALAAGLCQWVLLRGWQR